MENFLCFFIIPEADDLFKPEMAIAITPFQALCGFRSPATIANFLRVIPELRQVVGNEGYSAIQPFEDQSGEFTDDAKKTALRSVFRALMNADSALVKEQVDLMARRFKNESSKGKEVDRSLKELAVSLDQQFPGDVGVFCIFFLNVISLNPSQAIFLQANEPHAYLSGGELSAHSSSITAILTPNRYYRMHGYLRSDHFSNNSSR
jgi:mannose-6-phosphate isomerase